jgi:hypothetical protein
MHCTDKHALGQGFVMSALVLFMLLFLSKWALFYKVLEHNGSLELVADLK